VVWILTIYPSYEAVARLHEEIVMITGGEQGFVSPSNLAYVLETAKDIGENLSEANAIVRKSGYLLFNLVNLHPFLDGNKRTAFEVTKDFLNLNGWKFDPQEDDAFATLISISKGDSDAATTERWVARNLSKGKEKQ
jgi:death-on-curing protein